jgi:hypothetical protein
MAPELETLDQLLGGDLSLAVVRQLYPDDETFRRGVLGLFTCGDVRLFMMNHTEMPIPEWRWRELFVDGEITNEISSMKLSITKQGINRIA